MILPGYKVFIRFYDGYVLTRMVQANSKYDLFAYIGYLYSTTLTKIVRIDYKPVTAESDEWDLSVMGLKHKYESEV